MSFHDNPHRSLPHTALSGADDEPGRAPSAEALLAATLALMTGVVERAALTQPLADHAQSLLMATQVRAHLHSLSGLAHASPGFRETLARLRLHWDRLAGVAPLHERSPPEALGPSDTSRLLWMTAPATLQ